jgi:hypothetical protein
MCCGINLERINTSGRITGHQTRNNDKERKEKYVYSMGMTF